MQSIILENHFGRLDPREDPLQEFNVSQIASNWSLMCMDHETPSKSTPQAIIHGEVVHGGDDVKVEMEVGGVEKVLL